MYHIMYCRRAPIGDEPFLHTLEQTLEELNYTCLITHCSDSFHLLAGLSRAGGAYDLVFWDVSREEGTTVPAALAQLCQTMPHLPVVLLGGRQDRQEDDGRPVYTLPKPVSRSQLVNILQTVFQPSAPLLLQRLGPAGTIPLNQVLYIEVFDHLLKIHTLSQQVLSVFGTLSRLQREAPSGHLLRCHKSYLVNLAHVEGIQRYQISLSGGLSIPTSKQNYNQVRQSVIRYKCRTS